MLSILSQTFSVFEPVLPVARLIVGILFSVWWLWLPIVLASLALRQWQEYTRTRYLRGMKWVLLEVVPPPEVQRSPKIAENFFSGLHGIYGSSLKWKKMFFDGKIPDWFTCEIVGDAQGMRFYIRTPAGHRNLLEAHVFAQWPEAEIREAEDYTSRLPQDIPNEQYDLFGTELIFTKEHAYPIRTYPFFEEQSGKDEYVRTDPMAALAEVMSSLRPGEHVWLQLTLRPTGGDWVKEGQKVVDKIMGKDPKAPDPTFGQKVISFIDLFVPGGKASEEKKEKKDFNVMALSPGQRAALEQIELKLSKLAFKAGFRFVYLADKTVFNRARIAGVIGYFKQFYANDLNSFKPNGEVTTAADGKLAWLFPSGRGFGAAEAEYKKKVDLLGKYRGREFVKDYAILNIEELATLWHLPGLNVKAAGLPRVEAKKSTPPANLPGF
ncbi:MAG: hypothetical protein QY311_00975 [Candidatus Paceibacterota bacterium]|nr:MAG: hypothetical protein QY311_00975 [Candidatus Paceibacterota bacterium]